MIEHGFASDVAEVDDARRAPRAEQLDGTARARHVTMGV
jgi:hypothetical protein